MGATWIRAAVVATSYKSLTSIERARDHIVNDEFTIVLCGRVKPSSLLDDPQAVGVGPLCLKCYSEMLKLGIKLESSQEDDKS